MNTNCIVGLYLGILCSKPSLNLTLIPETKNLLDIFLWNPTVNIIISKGVCESTAADWVTVLLLHTFHRLLGVANFYLGHIGLGVTQLFLSLTIPSPS